MADHITQLMDQMWDELIQTTITGHQYLSNGQPNSGHWGAAKRIRDQVKSEVEIRETTRPSGTVYTLVLSDASKAIEMTDSAASTITVPANVFAVGTVIEIYRHGTGEVTLAPASGVTFRSPGNARRLTLQYSSAAIRQRGTNEWVLVGDLKV